jgi:hypothetical protein
MFVQGYHRTRSVKRYAARLFISRSSAICRSCGIYGEFPNSDNFLHLNVLFTLFFGLLILRALHEEKHTPLRMVKIGMSPRTDKCPPAVGGAGMARK